MTLVIYVLLMLVVTVADALRDRWISGYLRHSECYPGIDEAASLVAYVWSRPWQWWRWHLAKWIAFYTPLGTITYVAMKYSNLLWYEVVVTAILMFFIWRKVYAKE